MRDNGPLSQALRSTHLNLTPIATITAGLSSVKTLLYGSIVVSSNISAFLFEKKQVVYSQTEATARQCNYQST